MSRLLNLLVVVMLLVISSTTSAHAYVDPGSGSVIVTTILGLIAAVGYTFRKYYYKIKNVFIKDKGNDKR